MISIIMPTYNAETFISESIHSVLSQTYTDWELLVIDDCSTDHTAAIVHEFIISHPNIRYHKNTNNLGAGGSRNIGITLSKGSWIAFLDSDDLWHPNKLKLQLQCADEHQASFTFSGSSFINEYGKALSYYLEVPAVITYKELLKQNIISCSSVMIRKEIIVDYPMLSDPSVHEDFVTWLRILKEQIPFANGINQPLLHYRVHQSSKSSNKIKAAKMTYNAYKRLELGFFPSLYYWCIYVKRSLSKYKKVYKKTVDG